MLRPRSASWQVYTAVVLLAVGRDCRADNVINDDQIVKGCLAVGLDAVVDQAFGSDTIRLQENNIRIHFDDTSVTAGFSTNDWRIIINGDGSGAENFFAIEDSTATTTPFKISAGAPTGSIRVDNLGNLGLKTTAPALDIHVASGNTPAIRLEQTNGSGFTAQTWDIGGNDDNFFIRDATGGNKLPFLIKPGAPSNSLLISAVGNVGIGTDTPDGNSRMDLRSSLLNGLLTVRATADPHYLRVENAGGVFRSGVQGNGDAQFGALTPGKGLNLLAGGTSKVAINSTGQISFGNTPSVITDKALVHQSGAHLTLGGVWTSVSCRAAKQDIEPITSEQARDTVRALQPVGYRYKSEPDERYVGFIAEDVPELVATRDRKGLAPMDIAAVLTRVVQDQDRQLEKERERNDRLEATVDRQQQLMTRQQGLLALLNKRLAELERQSERVAYKVSLDGVAGSERRDGPESVEQGDGK
ncbi:MAG: tail fiber domain-containing protein [Planctomycetota bacterium]